MARRTKGDQLKVDDRVLDILSRFTCKGNVALRYTEQIDRKDYQALSEILEALGGKWTKASKALPGGGHVFPEGTDAAERIEAAILTGSVANPRAGDFFETPVALAKRMCELAGVGPGKAVLEPSAGLGRIAMAARDAGAHVVCCERDPARAATLARQPGLSVLPERDFLGLAPHGAFDAVLMNPPFSQQADCFHVAHALRFLRPGGWLVAVVSAGFRFRQTHASCELREQLAEYPTSRVVDLPDGTFEESGTGVRTCLVTVRT
jgi:type I restriction-modification system DNA methylase subunit